MDIDIEVRFVSERDIYAVTAPRIPSASLEVQSLKDVSELARSRAAEITGTDVETVMVASVVELDDGDGD